MNLLENLKNSDEAEQIALPLLIRLKSDKLATVKDDLGLSDDKWDGVIDKLFTLMSAKRWKMKAWFVRIYRDKHLIHEVFCHSSEMLRNARKNAKQQGFKVKTERWYL